jgi:hypothetical protein
MWNQRVTRFGLRKMLDSGGLRVRYCFHWG